MKYLIPSFIFALLVSVPSFALAQPDSDRPQRGESDKQELMEQRTQDKETSRCENFEKKISVRARHFRTLGQNATKRFDNLLARLENLSTKATEANLDTTTLDSQIVVLSSMIDELKISYEGIALRVEALGEHDCLDDSGAYTLRFEALRDDLAALHAQASEIRVYFEDEIKPTLLDLRHQFEGLKNDQ